ncbi:MAG: hypothetical protein JJU27_07205 [Gammaproteobacteria bacterium]|nr:hypothetical protein [Gammaproteobacteria bacterium]
MVDDNDTGKTPTSTATDEPQFLPHPLLDRLLDISTALGAELWAERERRMTLERLLEARGIISAADIEQYRPTENEAAMRRAGRDEFVRRIFEGLKTL